MRIACLLPSATEIACLLGLRDKIAGITHECDYPPGIEREKPALIESCLGPEGKHLPPGEIDRRIKETLKAGEGVYRIKRELFESLDFDLVITQGLCDVCAVPRGSVLDLIGELPRKPKVLSLDPTSLEEILGDITRVGEATGTAEKAKEIVAGLRGKIADVCSKTEDLGEDDRPRVACIEWLDPIFAAGHWVPEMVELAGGRDVLARPGEVSVGMHWERVVEARPEVLIVLPCGYELDEARAQMKLLTERPGWNDLPAVRAGRVYLVNATAYFSRPGPRLVEGLAQLAQMLHPERFPVSTPAWVPAALGK